MRRPHKETAPHKAGMLVHELPSLVWRMYFQKRFLKSCLQKVIHMAISYVFLKSNTMPQIPPTSTVLSLTPSLEGGGAVFFSTEKTADWAVLAG